MERDSIDFVRFSSAGYPVKRFPKGTTVFSQGDDGTTMYVVSSGKVELAVDGRAVETVEADGTFGEMSLIDGSPRSATAVTLEESELAIIDRRAFVFLVHETPYFALDVMGTLASRLRRMNSLL